MGPELPIENTGIIPTACQASITTLYQVSPRPPPHELLIKWGAREQSGLDPLASVGQVKN